MFKWLAKRRQRKAKSRFNSGYDYALGALLRGEATEEELLIQADCVFDHNEFDDGIVNALRDLQSKYAERSAHIMNMAMDVELPGTLALMSFDGRTDLQQRIDAAFAESERIVRNRHNMRSYYMPKHEE